MPARRCRSVALDVMDPTDRPVVPPSFDSFSRRRTLRPAAAASMAAAKPVPPPPTTMMSKEETKGFSRFDMAISLRRHAAVDSQDRTRHERGFVGCEEKHAGRDLVRLPGPVLGLAAFQFAA